MSPTFIYKTLIISLVNLFSLTVVSIIFGLLFGEKRINNSLGEYI